ncbi:MAG: glycosyltransferase family 2 protein [Verrucomicrobiia bacterium]
MASIDIIVPCYRYAHFLRECVESVLAETSLKVRVLIIDDASPDNTAEVAAQLVREDARVNFIRHTVNKRHIATYNEGIDWVTADYLLLLSADDYLLPNALKRAVDYLETHPQVGFTFGKALISTESGIKTPPAGLGKADLTGSQELSGLEFIHLIIANKSVNIVPTPSAVVRTALQKRVGGYRPELPHSGDLEMWLRLAAHGGVGMLNAYQAVWRRHGGNMQLDYYGSDYQLPDLEQRKSAIECFIQACGLLLPDAPRLRHELLVPLAAEAVAQASRAFNNGDEKMSPQLSQFALSVCPQIRSGMQWKQLAFKRFLGVRLWRVLRLALPRIGQKS